jgi:ribonuclease-3 family protein
MTNYFDVSMDANDIKAISNLGLAHIGDAVYELLVRAWLCLHGGVTAKGMHRATVAHVAAPAQAEAAEKLLPILTPEELAVYKRGRNTRVNSVPRNATHEQYHSATGLETLFGYIYLTGDTGRINELFTIIMDGEGKDAT